MPTVGRWRDFDDPWTTITALERSPELDRQQVVDHFLDLVARRRSTSERDALLCRGHGVFQYRLHEALAAVEERIIENMVTATPRRR